MKDHTWTELTPRLLAVPLGATEQHGPHLPFTVDTEIAVALCESVARQRKDLTVAPALPYGSSGEHAGFPGTLSIGQSATRTVLMELVRSADAFDGVVLVCAHGGNAEPLRTAVAELRYEGRKVHAWMPSGPSDDSHAGRTETSVMLALRPESVRLGKLKEGNTTPLPELIDSLRDGGIRAVSRTGVLGDPRGASAEEGREVLHGWVKSLLDAVAALASDVML